ncbi:MAG: hypothetical protein DLM68_11735 [Hyphomicrobiales bacterium]|nr:MAG: hypothetical protein DLM68_11735 [Hyphomicrobiales bacterium]
MESPTNFLFSEFVEDGRWKLLKKLMVVGFCGRGKMINSLLDFRNKQWIKKWRRKGWAWSGLKVRRRAVGRAEISEIMFTRPALISMEALPVYHNAHLISKGGRPSAISLCADLA